MPPTPEPLTRPTLTRLALTRLALARLALLGLPLAGLGALSLSRFVPGDAAPVVRVASFSSYAVLGYAVLLVGCLVLLLRRRTAGRGAVVCAGLALVGLVAHGFWLAPLYAGDGDHRDADLTVMTANLEFGRGVAANVVRAVAEDSVDVLVLEEVTPDSLVRLRRAGLGALLPHQVGETSTGAAGTLVLSRWPLGSARPVPLANRGYVVAVRAPRPFTVVAAHAAMPLIARQRWAADLQQLGTAAATSVAAGPTVVAGDLNATRDHAPFRSLLDVGLREAGEEAGSGWVSTWPTGARSSWLRPVIAIDHVLTSRELTGVRTRTVEVGRTDHLALVADLAWVSR